MIISLLYVISVIMSFMSSKTKCCAKASGFTAILASISWFVFLILGTVYRTSEWGLICSTKKDSKYIRGAYATKTGTFVLILVGVQYLILLVGIITLLVLCCTIDTEKDRDVGAGTGTGVAEGVGAAQ